MPLQIPTVGEVVFLNDLTTNTLDGAKLCLFKNVLADIPFNATLATFTEANYSGYARLTLNSWGVAAIMGATAFVDHAPRTFLHNGGGVPNDIYGYFVLNAGGTDLLYGEIDPFGPVVMAALNDPYRVIPQFSFRSQY